ncbi:unnamed protein product [Timema podura]|uniref:Uncharacterized protein n=1 Tax=Timema podura TaxID=61482 RepID=A0ABN7NTN7_TIMPD|nr:unnamed protein product [Timema podura]
MEPRVVSFLIALSRSCGGHNGRAATVGAPDSSLEGEFYRSMNARYLYVRERSVRSVPMSSRTNTTTSRSSFSGGTRTPDSLSDNESSLTRPLRKGSAPVRSTYTPGGSLPGSKAGSRPNSRPASRQGSKPPSRHGSTLSLDSTDEGTPSRIPVHQRRVTPASSTLPRSNASSSARKLTVPVNGTPGSRPRTPTGSGLISPASGVASSRSRIPVFVGSTSTESQLSSYASSSG